jgi:xylulokinase
MARSHVLAVDLGTSGAKVAVVDGQGRLLDHEFEGTATQFLPGGGAEQDPREWWRAISSASQRLMERHPVDVADIGAVSVTAQWIGTVPVSGSGENLMNALIWMDSRGAKYVSRVTGGRVSIHGYGVGKLWAFLRKSGGLPSRSGKDPMAHILYLKSERPEIYKAADKFLEPADYVNARLCGRMVSSADCIAGHWLTDNRVRDNITYDRQLLAMSGIDGKKLPDLVPSATVVGEVMASSAADLGILQGTKVVTATGDIHSAVLGSGAMADYAGHLYIGTSSWLSCHVPWKRTDIANNQASIPSALPGRYFIANEHETAGECLDFLKDTVFYADDELETPANGTDVYAAFELLAERAEPGSNSLIFTPWLNGERTPVEDATIRGGWDNISLRTTRADMVRSVYEGVAYDSRWLLEAVESFAKHRLGAINFIGGGARSDLWCQIHADVMDREIHQMDEPQQANLRGAAFVALIALGEASAEELASGVPIRRRFTPDRHNRATYDSLFGEFKKLYTSHRAMCARLNRS